jgi:hypothetical protein
MICLVRYTAILTKTPIDDQHFAASDQHLQDCRGELVVDILDEVSELPGPDIVAMAIWGAEAVDGVLELESFFELEALDDEPDLALGELRTFFESAFVLGFRPLRFTSEIQEAREVLSGLVREFDPLG